jgi:hypothetical protein
MSRQFDYPIKNPFLGIDIPKIKMLRSSSLIMMDVRE